MEESFYCENCDFASENQNNLNKHLAEEHNNEKEEEEVFDIKLEVFALVDIDNDVLKARGRVIEKLKDQKEVIEVSKVFVSKVETHQDVDNLRWNKVDIFLKSNKKFKLWEEVNFRKNIFSKCYLWETFKSFDGEISRKDLIRIREENINADLRSRGYVL